MFHPAMIEIYLTNFYQIVYPVLFFSAAIVVYAAVIGTFYKWVSKRDIFTSKKVSEARERNQGNIILRFFLNLFEYGILFPVIVIIWFSLFSILLFLLSPSQSIEALLTMSIALVSSVRIVSYFNEDIAVDLAKLFPLVLLGAFLLEPNFFSVELFYSRVYSVPSLLPKLLFFTAVPVLVEWVLRIFLTIKRAIFK